MPLTFKPSRDNKSILILARGPFDLSLASELWQRLRQGSLALPEEVVVDLGRIEAVFESGFVLLMMLRRWSRKVRLINCSAEIAKRVAALGMGAFVVAEVPLS
jgi:ABC-type transporter Mla MlaB component